MTWRAEDAHIKPYSSMKSFKHTRRGYLQRPGLQEPKISSNHASKTNDHNSFLTSDARNSPCSGESFSRTSATAAAAASAAACCRRHCRRCSRRVSLSWRRTACVFTQSYEETMVEDVSICLFLHAPLPLQPPPARCTNTPKHLIYWLRSIFCNSFRYRL